MTISAPPVLASPPTPPTRSTPASFAAAGDAFLSWVPTAWANLASVIAWVYATALDVFSLASAAQSDRVLCAAAAAAVSTANPVVNAAAAAASAAAAAVSASTAQATNPDSPIRLNPRRITADFSVASAYNATSAGPITISEGVTVAVGDNATWSIN